MASLRYMAATEGKYTIDLYTLPVFATLGATPAAVNDPPIDDPRELQGLQDRHSVCKLV